MAEPSYDLAELLRSPLEPDPDDREPVPLMAWVLAFIAGLIGGGALVLAFTGSGSSVATAPTTPAPPPEPELVVVEPGPFPTGYTPIANDVALRPEAPIVLADRTLVPLTMMVRRGLDPAEVERPLGGRWELRTDGGVVASRRIVFDPIRPGVMSIEFPPVDDLPGEMVLVERWDGTPATGSIEIPWPGLPLQTDAPLEIDVGAGVTLRLTDVVLSNFLGQVKWELENAALGTVALNIDLLEADGTLLGRYLGGSADLDPEPRSGFINYFWEPSFRIDQNDAASVRFSAVVVLGSRSETGVVVPLAD